MDQPATLAPGRVLEGRYRLEELLGAGGMATVWLAVDTELERRVAIKALSETLLADRSYVARFEREARIAAGLMHPHLVKVFDYGSAQGRPYLVMEHVEGPTLAGLISDHEVEIDADRLAAELLDALGHIHAAGVIHRDVKPSNVLTDAGGSAKLTDFGIARPADATQLTQTGLVIGTLSYMAPEVKEGGVADERSDLYSLGMVLRECSRSDPSPALAALVASLTAVSRRQRPESAAVALASFQSHDVIEPTEPVEPTAPTVGQRRPSSSRRRQVAALALLAGAAALALAALNSGGGKSGDPAAGGQDARAEARQSDPPSQSPRDPEPTVTPPAPSQLPPAAEIACKNVVAARDSLAQVRTATEELAGDDKEAKKQIKEAFEPREEAVAERERRCREAAKAAPAGDAPRERGPEGEGPPGLEKEDDD